MTSEQTLLVRKSFHLLEQAPEVAALVFYRRLFEIQPALRPLFRHDIESQARKLMEMLGIALCLLETPARLATELEALGARHVGYGVRDEHYPIVGQALLDMLAEVLGPAFTEELQTAWREFFATISTLMQRGARRERQTGTAPPPGPIPKSPGLKTPQPEVETAAR